MVNTLTGGRSVAARTLVTRWRCARPHPSAPRAGRSRATSPPRPDSASRDRPPALRGGRTSRRAEQYDGADPVNLGSGRKSTSKDLVLIADLTGFLGELV